MRGQAISSAAAGASHRGVVPPSDDASGLVAPAAVEVVHLEAPLTDIQLATSRTGVPYRSLLAVALLGGSPLGLVVLSVDRTGGVTADRLADALRAQLEPELREAFGRRGLPLPSSLPVDGIPAPPMHDRGGPAARRSISVVVPTCCNPVALERCLRSILACDYGDFQVIVVENRPGTSATRRMLSARFRNESWRYVEEPLPGGSPARNAGLAVAEGDVVAFVDDDVVVDTAWLRRCAEAFDRADDIACVTGLILPLELETNSQLLLEQFAGFAKGFRRETYRLSGRETNPLLPYTPGAMGSGANTALRADVVRGLGGFDLRLGPATPTHGAEDLDLFIRVLREGHAVAYESSAMVWHKHPDGMSRLHRQVYRYGLGLGALFGKQLLAGPERISLLRAVPAGIRYTRDPNSRKNASKPADYPRRLDWLERVGMLLGPGAYMKSALRGASRRRSPMPR